MPQPTPGRRSSAALLCALALLLAGCSGSEGNLATYDADGGADALLAGTLSITDECVTVDADGTVTTPAFDGGVEVEGDTLVFHGARYPDGAKIELGGGETTDVSAVHLPSGCPTDHVFLVADD